MKALYNEIDPHAAAWLRELIREGLIAPGDVDERSICDLRGKDLEGYDRVHLFAGIGGWDHALNLAGWGDRPVWTGSAPCQSFSSAGKRKGHGDARNLWPEMLRLIRECRPATCFGEQVEAAIGFGWLDGVFVDLEEEGYACGAVVLPVASVGAPHIRQRIWWVADAQGSDRGLSILERGQEQAGSQSERCSEAGILDHPQRDGRRLDEQERGAQGRAAAGGIGAGSDAVGDTDGAGFSHDADASANRTRRTAEAREAERRSGQTGNSSFWDDYTLVACRDGKARRCPKPVLLGVDDELSGGMDLGGAEGGFPLTEKIPARAALLKGYGNAIVAECGAAFIQAYLEATGALTDLSPGVR